MIVGDVDHQAALLQVQKYFGDIPKAPTPPRNDVLEFEQLGYRHMELSATVQVPNLYMAWNVGSLATAKNPQDAFALTIIKQLLDSGITSRLEQRLVRNNKILSSVSVSYDPYQRGDSLFSISALPAAGVTLSEAQVAIQNEVDTLKQDLVNSSEIERVVTQFVANWIYSQDDLAGQARTIGNLEVNGFSHRLIDVLPQHFQAITAQDLQRVAQSYFNKDRLSILYLLPQSTTP